jgi:hypothetical protein
MAADPSHDPLIELDDRGRANLRSLGAKPRGRYVVTTWPDGTLVLHPAVVMSAQEAAMWREKPDVMRRIADDLEHPERAVPVDLDDDP